MSNVELRKRWVAALRSGKYEQGQSCLRSGGDEYCCLGVLCDIVINDARLNGDDRYTWDGYSYSDTYNFVDIDFELACDECKDGTLYSEGVECATFTEEGSLTQSVLNLVGLRDDTGWIDKSRIDDWSLFSDIPGGRAMASLAQLNDAGATFEQIADIIESEADALFE